MRESNAVSVWVAEHGGHAARIAHCGAVAPAGSWEVDRQARRQETVEAAELEGSLGSSVPLCSTLTAVCTFLPALQLPGWLLRVWLGISCDQLSGMV